MQISVEQIVCFRSDSLHEKRYGINFISVLQFKKLS